LVINWVLENGRRRAKEQGVGKKTHRNGTGRAIPGKEKLLEDEFEIFRLRGDIWVATARKAAQLKRSGLTAASALEEPDMPGAEVIKESFHVIDLVPRGRKMAREAASGEARRDLGVVSSAADTSDPGTCETMAAGERLVLALV
jgi:hypothetical protein